LSKLEKILLVFDSYGWCFENECLGIQKYSKYSCSVKPFNPIDLSILNEFDLIYFSTPSIAVPYISTPGRTYRDEKGRRRLYKDPHYTPPKKTKIVIGIASLAECGRIQRNADAFVGVSRELADLARLKFPDIPVEYIPDGVDPEIFYPLNLQHESFKVGWVGNFQRVEKRTHLLGRLNYEVHIKADRLLEPNISREPMRRFYNEMDVILLVSSSEGCSLVPLEAGACKTAFVGTRTGTVIDYIPDHWLVPCEAENETVRLINERLHELENNPEILAKYKEELYQKVITEYHWKEIVKKHEKLWESLF